MSLGKQFANVIGDRLSEADLYLAGAGKIELAERKAHTQLPDNEPLIMHALVGAHHVGLKQDIYAMKRNHKIFISLGDFVTAADFAISVKGDSGTADGWFIHEDQTFHLDTAKNQLTIMGKPLALAPQEIEHDGDNMLVSTEAIEKWFGITFDYDFANLALQITTTQPFPAEAAYDRLRKSGGHSYNEAIAKLPEQKVPYALASMPNVDTYMNASWSRAPGGVSSKTGNWSSIVNNDFAGFSQETYVGGSLNDSTHQISSLRTALGKQDSTGNLLGPLHATSYKFGDINAVSVPLVGGGGGELGFTATNATENVTNQTKTNITGNAQPGWDVELYRNDVYIDIKHVDINGLYNFENIDLVLGKNDMKLLFYGPQGEIHEEHKDIRVDPGLLAGHAGQYAVSVSSNQRGIWQPQPPTGPGVGDTNLAATYQYGLGKETTLEAGVRRHSDDGKERVFTETGLATYLGGTYVNTSVGTDAQTGASAANVTARRNFGAQSGVMQYQWNAKNFNSSTAASGATMRNSLQAGLSGPLPGHIFSLDHFNYSVTGTDTFNYDKSSQISTGGSLSARLSSVSLSSSMNYTLTKSPKGITTEGAAGETNMHGFAYGGDWRVDMKYDLLPKFLPTETQVQYDHAIKDNLDTLTQVTYTPASNVTDTSLSMNWRTQKATISPSIALDTTRNLRMGVNVHFGTAADPYSHKYAVYNTFMNGVGGVAARVFYDKNGNGIYDDGDELMPDVIVRAPQVHRNATTDARGIAFIPDIPQDTLTDIVADASSFKDSYGISLFEGVSLRVHPGSATQLDFPVVVGGELDGQADYVDDKGQHRSAGNIKVSLVAPDGHIEKTTRAAYDGYYAISSIRPGIYYLTAETGEDVPGAFTPRLLEFKPEGSTLFGQGITLADNGYNTTFLYSSENAAPDGTRHTRVVRPGDMESQHAILRLGQYHSRLALTFSWYRFKIRSPFGKDFTLAKELFDIKPDPKTQLMDLDIIPKKPISAETAANICQVFQQNKFECSVKVITRYREPSLSAGLPVKGG